MKSALIQYEVIPNLPQLIRLLVTPKQFILINSKKLNLPSYVLDEIEETQKDECDLAFQIKVNPALDSRIRVYRIQSRAAKLSLIMNVLLSYAFRTYQNSLSYAAKIEERISQKRAKYRYAQSPAASVQQNEAKPAPKFSWGAIRMRLTNYLVDQNQRIAAHLDKLTASKPASAGPKLSAYVLVNSIEHLQGFAFPEYLHVALTTHCNLKCIMCPYHSEVLRQAHTVDYFAHSKRMPPELFEKLIDEAGRHGATLAFGQYDEPFIYKGFTDYAIHAKEKGCRVSITTNGTLLTEDLAYRLIAAGIDHISFSLDAASAETYRKIRLDDFSIPLANIRRLAQIRDELGGRTVLRACLVVQEHNRHEQDAFRELMKEIGLDMVSFYVLSKYENGIWVNEQLNFNVEIPEIGQRYACSQLWSQMAVYPDGNVALCCATTMYLGYREDVPYVGNLHEMSLQEIWLSQKYREIRAEALRGEFKNSVCRDCQIWHNFQTHNKRDPWGHLVSQNPYETFVYLKDVR